MKKVLELFSGSGRISDYLKDHLGCECIKVDFDKSNKADLYEDIYSLDLKKLCEYYDIGFIWASPCCISYSLASHGLHRQQGGVPVSNYAISCDYWNNLLLDKLNELNIPYIVENPRGHFRNVFKDKFKYKHTTTYSAYGTPYMKPTDLFSNFDIRGKFRKGVYKKCSIHLDYVYSIKGTVGRSYIPDLLLNDIYLVVKEQLEKVQNSSLYGEIKK